MTPLLAVFAAVLEVFYVAYPVTEMHDVYCGNINDHVGGDWACCIAPMPDPMRIPARTGAQKQIQRPHPNPGQRGGHTVDG